MRPQLPWVGVTYCSLKQLVFLVYSASGVQIAPERFKGRATTELYNTENRKSNSRVGRCFPPQLQRQGHPTSILHTPLPSPSSVPFAPAGLCHPTRPHHTLRLSLRSW